MKMRFLRHIFLVTLLGCISTTALAQEYGLTLGFNQSSADVDDPANVDGKIEGKLGFGLGGVVAFELMPGVRFRSGLIYNQRHFDYKIGTSKREVNLAYLDVPVLAQYNLTPIFALYGGLVVGVKASESTKSPAGVVFDVDMKALYPLATLGVNLMFEDMFGFDVYYEHGLGEFASTADTSFKDSSSFGLRFIYWL